MNPTEEVWITCKCIDEDLVLSISNGIRTRQQKTDSTSIGLITCRRIIEYHRGHFTAEERDNRFCFVFANTKIKLRRRNRYCCFRIRQYRTFHWDFDRAFRRGIPNLLGIVQARVPPITDKFNDYAYEVVSKLEVVGVRVAVVSRNEKIGYRIYCILIRRTDIERIRKI